MDDVITELRNPETCPIWPEFRRQSARYDLKCDAYEIRGSARAGGNYGIKSDAAWDLSGEDSPYDDRVRARLTTKLIKMREQGQDWPMVTPELLREAQNAADMPVHERATRLLLHLSEQSDSIAQPVQLVWEPYQNPAMMEAAAVSECDSSHREVMFLVNQLHEAGLVTQEQCDGGMNVTLTLLGRQHVAALTEPGSSSRIGFNLG